MARAKKKSKGGLWLLLGIGGVAAVGGYMYYQKKKADQASAMSSPSSNAVQGAQPVPQELASPMEYPNSFSGTPTIQNFVTQPQTVTSSSATTIVIPPFVNFHHKPRPFLPHHPPTSPHMGGRRGH